MRHAGQILSDARILTERLLERGLTATQAAITAGLSPDTFYPLIRSDKRISLKTASKLRAAFGADSIKFSDRADYERL